MVPSTLSYHLSGSRTESTTFASGYSRARSSQKKPPGQSVVAPYPPSNGSHSMGSPRRLACAALYQPLARPGSLKTSSM